MEGHSLLKWLSGIVFELYVWIWIFYEVHLILIIDYISSTWLLFMYELFSQLEHVIVELLS